MTNIRFTVPQDICSIKQKLNSIRGKVMRKIIIAFVLISQLVSAQSKGTVKGMLTDGDVNNDPLPFANVFIKGTTIGGTTDFDGNYSLAVEEGEYVLAFSFVGYKTIEKNIDVKAGKTITINQKLSAASGVTLEEIEIRATINRAKVSALLLEQKRAVSIKATIGAQELSTKGISDVANAVTKLSGVTRQEGTGSVFVRGLGDRYNVTTFNGLPLPSNNPSNKNLDLNIFTTDVVESIEVSKTFEVQNFADFGGASIDIKSKNFRGKPTAEIILGVVKSNSNVLGKKNFYLQDGPNYLGFNTVKNPSSPLTPNNYTTSWDRESKEYQINNSFGILLGKAFEVGEESKISTFFTASFNSDSDFRNGVTRGGINKQGVARTDYTLDNYTYTTATTLMGTAKYKVNAKHTFTFNSLYLNSTSQNYTEFTGNNNEFDGGTSISDNDSGFIKRGTFTRTQLLLNQFLGAHKLSKRLEIDWATAYSISLNAVPDRMQNTFVPSRDGSDRFTFFSNSAIDNHRYFQDLDENEFSARIEVGYSFAKTEEDTYKGKFTFGYAGRFKDVIFKSNQYYFSPVSDFFNFSKDKIHHVDNFFNANNYNNSTYTIGSINQEYSGNLYVNGFFSKVAYKFSPKFTVVLGVRGESIIQNVKYKTEIVPMGGKSDFSEFEILPSVVAKYTLTEKQNLKFAASKSYTLPQFKEKVKLLYEEVTQGYQGNPDLYASDNYNVDLGWEYFPTSGEILSVTTFGKVIQNPINEVFINSASGDISYVNSGNQATLYGVEFEARKKIVEFESTSDLKNKLNVGFNLSFMQTNQDFSATKVSNENNLSADFTYTKGKLTGASDLLINSDISYLKEFSENSNITTTLSFGYFSDKLRTIGTRGRGHLIDKGNHTLDLIIKSNLSKKIKLGLSLKNLTNPIYERFQGAENKNVLTQSYKKGVDFSLSMSYKF